MLGILINPATKHITTSPANVEKYKPVHREEKERIDIHIKKKKIYMSMHECPSMLNLSHRLQIQSRPFVTKE